MTSIYIEYLLYAAFILSLGSYSAAFSTSWPTRQFYLWRKEAHELLAIPFLDDTEIQKETRSQCSHCFNTLAWWNLIPIVSYLLLKGRCHYCNLQISYRYPIIEFLHLTLCLPLFWMPLDTTLLILQTILISTLITIATVDLEHKLIPDISCVSVLICTLLESFITKTLESSVLGMLVGYCFSYFIYQGYLIFRKREGIGLGDVKLISVLGAWLGVSNLAPLLLCASLMGILYTILFSKSNSEQVAFGPFLVSSGIFIFYL